MKKIQSTLLASSLIAALFFSTAYAATSDADTNPHKMRDLVEMSQAEKNDQVENSKLPPMNNRHMTMMRRGGGPWKTLAELTGKDVNTIQQECHATHKSPYEYAKENGVEKQFQAKNLEAVKKGLSLAVADGKITQEKADASLARFIKFEKDEADGKIMRHRGPRNEMMNASGAISEGRNGTDYQAQVAEQPVDPAEQPVDPAEQPAKPIGMGLMPFDTLAELTGKDANTLMETCRTEQKTCYDIAKDSGVLDQYKEKRVAANKEILVQLVADGKISQEKAASILADAEKNISENKPEKVHMTKTPMNTVSDNVSPAAK
jgi:hypothetical protein